MNKMTVLVVEDDAAIRNLMEITLRARDYGYLSAAGGESAILAAASRNPDMILLDLGLPDLDGIEVIRRVRSWSDMPIIVISARSEDADKIEALDAGADDYLTKPFSVDELLARLRVAKRRILREKTQSISPVFGAGTVSLAGEEIVLTAGEYKLLCLFARHVGKVLTHTYITDKIWGNSLESDVASLRVFMASLRKKIEKKDSAGKYFQTHVGIGYRMNRL